MSSLTELVQTGLRRIGLDVRRVRREGAEYADVFPRATYSPWNTDRVFRAFYERIERYTLVDVHRCHELWTLTRDLAAVPGAILEIGVWRGGTGAVLGKAAELAGIRDPVYLCDTFRGVPKAGPRDPVYRGGEHADTSREGVEGLMRDLSLERVQVIEGVFPDESASRVTATAFRLVHVDVDVYDSAKDCVEYVWPRTSPGGVVVFDDYGFEGLGGIRQYVDEQRGRRGGLVVHNLNGHALLVKVGA
ncbi:MAG TPA: TylF/MycF/NovP-related O-methyltransferase [Polyangiaceae bacterium]|nr:TylF/MycF/NovP-related O-methyltransferase [Polyangiaceae bacterium]